MAQIPWRHAPLLRFTAKDKIMNALKASLGCLFIALALNTAFTFAQNVWLVPYPPIPQDRPWMRISTSDDSHKPESTTIQTTAIPTVTRISPSVWAITFRSTQ
jgi:hypothetical protein